ncbi:hypothetical protein Ancab_015116 [Ancistrocladus abbreviatus]
MAGLGKRKSAIQGQSRSFRAGSTLDKEQRMSYADVRLRNVGLPQCSVRYMGGDLMPISSTYTDILHSYMVEGDKRLAMWLAEIRPWNCKKILVITVGARLIKEVVQIKVNDLFSPVKVIEEIGGGFAWTDNGSQYDVQAGERAWGIGSNNESRVPATTDGEGSGSFEAEFDRDEIASLRVPHVGVCTVRFVPSKTEEGGGLGSHKSDNLNIALSRLKKKKVARPKDQLLYGLGLKHKIRSSRWLVLIIREL